MNTTIAWPNGLSVDWEELELFWTDAKLNYIQAIKLDGTARRTVVTGRSAESLFTINCMKSDT